MNGKYGRFSAQANDEDTKRKVEAILIISIAKQPAPPCHTQSIRTSFQLGDADATPKILSSDLYLLLFALFHLGWSIQDENNGLWAYPFSILQLVVGYLQLCLSFGTNWNDIDFRFNCLILTECIKWQVTSPASWRSSTKLCKVTAVSNDSILLRCSGRDRFSSITADSFCKEKANQGPSASSNTSFASLDQQPAYCNVFIGCSWHSDRCLFVHDLFFHWLIIASSSK